ncbi:cupin domain-containing protein [uncultured Meiothermus sp.]|uniref:cupin domain-containing protein n=1 Tax=uncultured Meiothermus sp. TaxID=157471 RepID=UPI0026299780|nr:cupin domain-containing protein [uncultured Meiothermus sp.]
MPAENSIQPYVFTLEQLEAQRVRAAKLYLEFLRVPSLSAGWYVLEAGAADPQNPHNEDEVYVVLRGKGKIRVGSQVTPVQPGSVVFVQAQVEHKFFDIQERLEILVIFGPAET